MTVTRQQFLSLLEPKLAEVQSDADFPRRPVIYTAFYGLTKQSKKATETYYYRAGLGGFSPKVEGGLISYTDPIAGSELAFSHVRRSNGYKITQEMLDHDQYNEIVGLEKDLVLAGMEDLEVAGHLVLNSGFGTTDNADYGFEATGFDSLALFSTAHTRLDGGTNQANRPSVDADLGVGALGDAIIQFQLWVDERGKRIRGRPARLVVHPNDSLTAKELLAPGGKPGTANNDINSLTGEGLSQDSVVVTPYLTDSDSWFVLGDDLSKSTVWHWDVQPRTAMQDDFDSETVKRKRVQGFSFGHRRWWNLYGTSGAG